MGTWRLRSTKSFLELRTNSSSEEQTTRLLGFLRNTDPLTSCPGGASWSCTPTDKGAPKLTTEGENRSNLGEQ